MGDRRRRRRASGGRRESKKNHRQEYWIISISAGDFTFYVFAYTYTKVLFI